MNGFEFELTHGDLGSTIHFSIFMMQISPPSQKILIPMYNAVSYSITRCLKYSRYTRLRHMRHTIAWACLCTCLKHQRRAKKSTPCLIKKASRCAADRMSKTTFFYLPLSLKYKDLTKKIMCICYFIGSVVKMVLYLHILYTKNDKL